MGVIFLSDQAMYDGLCQTKPFHSKVYSKKVLVEVLFHFEGNDKFRV